MLQLARPLLVALSPFREVEQFVVWPDPALGRSFWYLAIRVAGCRKSGINSTSLLSISLLCVYLSFLPNVLLSMVSDTVIAISIMIT